MKIKTIAILLLFVLLSDSARSQTLCNCEFALDKLVQKIEKEYPGFEQKTKDKYLYNNLKAELNSQVRNASEVQCQEILNSYLEFFKDRHIWLLPNEINAPTNDLKSAQPEILNVNFKKFKKEIVNAQNEFEGIWENDSYEIGIKKLNAKEYVGFIIKADPNYWKTNEIKFRLFQDGTYEYLMQDHSVQKGKYMIDADGFLYFKEILTEFVRKLPETILSQSQIDDKTGELNGFYFKQLSNRTSIVKLPNFSYPFVDTIEKLIEKNKQELENSEFLIIDLRDNGGGTDDAYQKLLPYVLTNPVRYIRNEFLSTPTLINGLRKYNESIRGKDNSQEIIERNENYIKLYEANLGKYVTHDEKVVVDTVSIEKKGPKQVVVLTNNKVASAGENLALVLKQSKKVKIMGTPTMGVLDYASVRHFEDFECKNYQLWMPTYRSLRIPDFPIDNIGVQPDIYLDSSIDDWVKYAQDYLEN